MVSTGSQAEYFRPEQTIIIFDWDDTLCPSSWIRANKKVLSFFKPAPTTEKYQKPLRELQAAVEVLLKMSMKLGTVVIVTNAMDPWVDTWPHHGGQRAVGGCETERKRRDVISPETEETSCRNFLPSLLPLVSTLPVIYARSIFEQQGVDVARREEITMARSPSGSGPTRAMPGMYAANGQNRLEQVNVAFAQEIKDFYSRYQHQSWKNVISVGDSVFERDAVRRVVLQRPTPQKKCRTKTLKLFAPRSPRTDGESSDSAFWGRTGIGWDGPAALRARAGGWLEVKVVYDVINVMVQYDGDLDIEIDEEDLKMDGPLLEKLRE
ncbi:Uncharacterized protein SCF082_LOCUS31476 [Durusdinium trenchii]|uniref:Uncharacterized protein n=1 Tax=Durusdinium trenchii TaxID=1381693 RepID=A0ABP0N6P5_9DINO